MHIGIDKDSTKIFAALSQCSIVSFIISHSMLVHKSCTSLYTYRPCRAS